MVKHSLISIMRYSPKQYAQALHQAIFESRPADQEKILDNFVTLLKQNQDLGMLDQIEAAFFAFERELKGVKLAEVTTARNLGREEESKLIRELNEYVGGQVELKKKIDEGVVGGVLIRIGDELIDGSVRRNLKDLKEQLKM